MSRVTCRSRLAGMRAETLDEIRMNKPSVAIFRLDLFKNSETFIAAQAARLTRYRPVFVGRNQSGNAPVDAEVASLGGGLRTTVEAMLMANPAPFIRVLNGRLPRIIHAHFAVDAAFALPLAHRLGVPLVTTLHGFDVTTRDTGFLIAAKPTPIVALARRGSLQRKGDLFVCVSDFIRRAALDKGFPEKRTIVAPLGIDVKRYSPVGDVTPGLVVHIGRLVEKKGTVYLIRAVSRIPNARLVVVGDGPLRERLEAEVNALGINNRVFFTGAVDHQTALDWIRKAAVVAVPSVTALNGDSEGLPTVIFEAGSLGRAVVASDTSGIPEAVENKRTGFLVPERDVPGLVEMLSRLLNNLDLARQFGASARLRMVEKYDASTLTESLEMRYDELIKNCSGPK